MPEDMNLSINGQSQVPPGFRFHPTEEELLHYYLRKKVACEKIDLDVIREVDLNKLEPWDIQEKCRIGSTPQNDWYFFSHKDKKYPTGTRTNRATAEGFWKATGRDKIIYSGCRRIGMRKTLVFYTGRAPHGQKSDWIMHEYRLEESKQEQNALASSTDMNMPEEGWVVCRVFRKKNYQKAFDSPRSTSKLQLLNSASHQAGLLDKILSHMEMTACKVENERTFNLKYLENSNKNANIGDGSSGYDISKDKCQLPPENVIQQKRFMHLPGLDSPSVPPPPAISCNPPHLDHFQPLQQMMLAEREPASSSDAATPENSERLLGPGGPVDWASLDRLVASQLNGQAENPGQATEFGCFGNDIGDIHQLHQVRPNGLSNDQSLQILGYENDFSWNNFMVKSSSSSSDPLRHLSV